MKKYGILAYPAKHSLSPVMHNAAFSALKIDAEYGFFEIPPQELESFVLKSRTEISGFSVSVPYKRDVVKFLDFVDEDASKIGAVNTVVNKNGKLYGYNTDFLGAITALKEVCGPLNGKNCVVAGAGGAGRAISYGLLREGANVYVEDKMKDKAYEIAKEFSEIFGGKIYAKDLNPETKGDIFIHATSAWLNNPDISISDLPFFCDKDFLADFDVVMDISYNNSMKNFKDPLKTPLILAAEKLNKKVVTGEKMLLNQAIEQFKLWTGKKPPEEAMNSALYKALIVS